MFSFGGAAPPANPAPAPPAPSSRFESRLLRLRSSVDPTSPDCRFQCIFYNRLPPSSTGPPQPPARPPTALEALWNSGISNNPDPNALVPVLGVGFSDLSKRLSEQRKAASAFSQALESLEGGLVEMKNVHQAISKDWLEEIRREHARQAARLLCLVNRLESHRTSGLPVLGEELEFRKSLENLAEKLNSAGPAQARARQLAASARLIQEKSADSSSLAAPSPSSLSALHKFLAGQGEGLAFLTTSAINDGRTLENIKQFQQTQERNEE